MNYNHKADQQDLKARDEELYNIVITACAIRDELSFEHNGEPATVTETEKHLYDCIERWRNRFDAVLDPGYTPIDIDEFIDLEKMEEDEIPENDKPMSREDRDMMNADIKYDSMKEDGKFDD